MTPRLARRRPILPGPAVRRRRRIEWPTVALAGVIYCGWIAVTLWHAALPVWIWVPALVWLVAWHSSLQHEVIHGHPTRWRMLNDLIGYPPLSLWLPFATYRAAHLSHHRDERLTDPLDDPESFYWTPQQWAGLSGVGRFLVQAQASLVGRLVVGPGWLVCRFLDREFHAISRGDRQRTRGWLLHAPGALAVAIWVIWVCAIDPLLYLLAVVYPATSLLLLRSFAEHRAASGVFERTAIVEKTRVLGLLFLFNNLHAAHHDRPGLPWYRLPSYYRTQRARLVLKNGGLLYGGYRDVACRFLLRPYDRPLHPLGRASRRT